MMLGAILGLYNYWVVVFLMMTGFYIVIASRNLIKSVLGLNIFQTSVFLLYITMGKINGATAPIIPAEFAAQAAHGHGQHSSVEPQAHHHEQIEKEDASAHHNADSHDESHADAPSGHDHDAGDGHAKHGDAGHSETEHGEAQHLDVGHPVESGVHDEHAHEPGKSPSLRSNTSYSGITGIDQQHVTYSNPLPSVLMLTAIVVGIATTALALALIVRIREDYGSVEEDEIMEMDLSL